jgi:immune inhibitor A
LDNLRRSRRIRISAALLSLALLILVSAVSCRDDGKQSPAASATPSPAIASATPSPQPSEQTTFDLDSLPSRDLFDLARRLEGVEDAPYPVNATPQNLAVGDHQVFKLVLMPSPGEGQDVPPEAVDVGATLRAVTTRAYFYVEDDTDVPQDAIDQAAQSFEDHVYPTVTKAMGHEASPGVDNDVHITIFNGNLEGAAGYFSDLDGYPKEVAPLSNEREMVYMDLSLDMGSSVYDEVLGHELQHLIHANGNPREDLWVNEGLSEVAGSLAGQPDTYGTDFLKDPDTQLNEWDPSGDNYAHYGAAGLFFRYLAMQTGGFDNLGDLVFESGKGITGIADHLDHHGGLTFDQLFADWLVANYTDDPSGYLYSDQRAATTPLNTSGASGEVHQYGADYIEADEAGTLTFDGSDTAGLLDEQPHSGTGQWWSARGDDIDTTLTRAVDLSNVGSATLNFWTWFDIERWYDYGYVEVSSDNGQTWQVLKGQQTTDDDPLDQAYGPGYTGESGGGSTPEWVKESIDLSRFAGQKMLLRFEYVTDGGLNTPGWAIDDISIAQIGLSDDVETDGNWTANGFQRLTGPVAQHFIVQVIELGIEGNIRLVHVREIPLDANNEATIALRGPDQGVKKSIVVVAATTYGTSEEGTYQYSFATAP